MNELSKLYVSKLRGMLVLNLIAESNKICSLDGKNDKLRNDNTELIIDVAMSFMDALDLSKNDKEKVLLDAKDYFVDGDIRNTITKKLDTIMSDNESIEIEMQYFHINDTQGTGVPDDVFNELFKD